MFFNKIVLLVVTALVAAPLAMTEAAGGPEIPAWCLCKNSVAVTGPLCRQAGANWDGGSCGIANTNAFWAFYKLCPDRHCWR
ncbi:MAG: hypothetical protein BYD32DRAFT_412567 [Podila humilis]|nr:MAG: hypothetical protein BYD32DRAFT_412567 [Podila humilis]